MPLNDDTVRSWLKDPEFQALPTGQKRNIILKHFDDEYTDDEFFAKPPEEQDIIRTGFLRGAGAEDLIETTPDVISVSPPPEPNTPQYTADLNDPYSRGQTRSDRAVSSVTLPGQVQALEPSAERSQRLAERADIGMKNTTVGELRFRQLNGEDTPEIRKSIADVKASMPEKPKHVGWLEDFAGATLELIPLMVSSAQNSARRALEGASTGAVAGAIAGNIGAPVTAPAGAAMGAAAGAAAGSVEYISGVEAGLAYDEMLELKDDLGNKIDPEIARGVALGVGAINGLLELGQIGVLLKTIPGGKQLGMKAVQRAILRAVKDGGLKAVALRAAAGATAYLGLETAQEVAQEATVLIGDYVAAELTAEMNAAGVPELQQAAIVDRLQETAVESLKAFALLGAPGSVMKAGLDARDTILKPGEEGKTARDLLDAPRETPPPGPEVVDTEASQAGTGGIGPSGPGGSGPSGPGGVGPSGTGETFDDGGMSPGVDAVVDETAPPYQPSTPIEPVVESTDADTEAGAFTEEELDNAEKTIEIEDAGKDAALSPDNDRPEPSPAQKEAGNYKKGHVNVKGLDVTIENPKGSERKGVDPDGKEWSITLNDHYGYFKRSEGKDGDQVDVFLGPMPEVGGIFIVDQVDPKTGEFDEHKVMLGYADERAAVKAYHANYEDGWSGMGAITEVTPEQLRDFVKSGRQTKPVGSIAPAQDMQIGGLSSGPDTKDIGEIADQVGEQAARAAADAQGIAFDHVQEANPKNPESKPTFSFQDTRLQTVKGGKAPNVSVSDLKDLPAALRAMREAHGYREDENGTLKPIENAAADTAEDDTADGSAAPADETGDRDSEGGAGQDGPLPSRKYPGQKQRIFGINGEVVRADRVDGVDYELYRSVDDDQAVVRVFDAESGNVVSTTKYPDFKAAKAAFDKVMGLIHGQKDKTEADDAGEWITGERAEELFDNEASQVVSFNDAKGMFNTGIYDIYLINATVYEADEEIQLRNIHSVQDFDADWVSSGDEFLAVDLHQYEEGNVKQGAKTPEKSETPLDIGNVVRPKKGSGISEKSAGRIQHIKTDHQTGKRRFRTTNSGQYFDESDWEAVETSPFFVTDKGEIVTAEKGPQADGGYTFYAKRDIRDKGRRIKGTDGNRLWYSTLADAREALTEYGHAHGWTPAKTVSDAIAAQAKTKKEPGKKKAPDPGPLFRPKKEAANAGAQTIRSRIKEMGFIRVGNFTGEFKEAPLAVRMLTRQNSGMSIDLVEKSLIEEGWMREGENLLDLLTDGESAVDFLKRRHLSSDYDDKAVAGEMRDEEEPPDGEYVRMKAEDLPLGKELTIIEGESRDGWDVYEIIEKDPFSITLKDGTIIELPPLQEVDVLKSDLETEADTAPEKVPLETPDVKTGRGMISEPWRQEIFEKFLEYERRADAIPDFNKGTRQALTVQLQNLRTGSGSRNVFDAILEEVEEELEKHSKLTLDQETYGEVKGPRTVEGGIKSGKSKKKLDEDTYFNTPSNRDPAQAGVPFDNPRQPKLFDKPAEKKPMSKETKIALTRLRDHLENKGAGWIPDPDDDSAHIIYRIIPGRSDGYYTVERTIKGVRTSLSGKWDMATARHEAIQDARAILEGGTADEKTPEPTPKQDTGPIDIGTAGDLNVLNLARLFIRTLRAGTKTNKIDLQKIVAKALGMSRADMLHVASFSQKPIEEAMEYAIVLRAREIIQEGEAAGKSVRDIYFDLKALYEIQPNLNTRSATSTINQAYSTPVHLGYLMQKMIDNGNQRRAFYEPTAGTGMLLTTADTKSDMIYANEIDETRSAILEDLGFMVANHDGMKAIQNADKHPKPHLFDVVLANPPFGKGKVVAANGFRLSNIEHKIMANALQAMKDDGRAAFIVGGHNFNENGEMPGPQQIFKHWLYHHYNVVHNIEIPGSEYGRQGTTYPVRVFIIEGRDKNPDPNYFGPPENPSDPAYERVDSVDDLLEIGGFNATLDTAETEAIPEGPDTVRGDAGQGAADRPPVSAPPRRETDDSDRERTEPEGPDSGRDDTSGRTGEPGTAGEQPPRPPGVDEGGQRSDSTQDTNRPVPEQPDKPGRTGGGPGPRSEKDSERGRVPEGTESGQAEGLPSSGDSDLDDILSAIDEKGNETRAKERAAAAAEKKAKAEADFDSTADEINALFDDPAFSRTTPQDSDSVQNIADDDAVWLKIKPLLDKMWSSTVDMAKTVKERAMIFIQRAYERLRSEVKPYLKKFANTVIADELAAEKSGTKSETVRERAKQEEKVTTYQATYRPQSRGNIIDETLIPVNMREGVEAALKALESEVGPIDDYVMKEVGFKSKEELYSVLSADQIDGVGLGIWNLSKGKGMIIGDQTGVGKGRIAATIYRWAQKNGKKPIFFTEKPNLFNDFYRDIRDIGHDIRPYLMAAKIKEGSLRDPSGRVVAKPAAGSLKKKFLEQAAASEAEAQRAMDDYDGMLTTYSQIMNPNKSPLPPRAIGHLGPGNIFILDESHNASGSSNTGEAVKRYLETADGVVYLSATYAKRPDTLPLYSKTSMGDANMEFDEMVGAIQAGGTPLQEWVSAALSKLGQYVRREKSFEGIDTRWIVDTENRARDVARADQMTSILRKVLELDTLIIAKIKKDGERPIKNAVKKKRSGDIIELFGHEFPATGTTANGSTVGASINTTSFASVVHNAVRQLMFAMKADTAADRAIAALKEGKKPLIALSNTMESFLIYSIEEGVISVGDDISTLKFSDVMRRHLSKVMQFSVKMPNGDVRKFTISVDQLPPELQEMHANIVAEIETAHSDLPGSPIDHIRARLEIEGYKVGELTNRDYMADLSDPRKPVLVRTSPATRMSRNDIVAGFNDGTIDVLIANQAGSTGLSAHAGPKFKDQRPRRYIGAQAELNVDTEVQKMGRINRKAQVALPDYEFLFLDLPMEIRPAAVLKKKMASLNANTSAKADSPLQQKDIPDMMNRYGDAVVSNWVATSWPAHENSIDGMVTLNSEFPMSKTSGRIAVAPTAVQDAFYEEVEADYNALIQEKKDLGTYDLESEDIDFKAVVTDSQVMAAGENEGNPFQSSATLETLRVVNPRKPYKMALIKKKIEQALQGKTPKEFIEELREKLIKGSAAFVEKRKAEGVSGDQLLALMSMAHDNLMGTQQKLNRYLIGEGYGIKGLPGVDDADGILIDIKHTPGRAGNPAAQSKTSLVLAVNNSFQRVIIPLSKIGYEKGQYGVYPKPFAATNWDQSITNALHVTRHVITGNLLQGSDKIPEGSRIIRFSMEDGTWREGILMPLNYTPGESNKAQFVRVGTAKAVDMLMSGAKVWSVNRDIEITKDADAVYIVMPRYGAMKPYFQDLALNGLAYNEFSNTANQKEMSARFPADAKTVKAIMERIHEIGGRFDVSRARFDQANEDVPFKLSRPSAAKTSGMKVSALQDLISSITDRWKNAPPIVIVSKQSELPQAVLDLVPDGDRVDGVLYSGKVYLVAANIANADHAQETLVHEALRHYGLRSLLGEQLTPVLMDVYRAKTKEVAEIAAEYGYDITTKVGKLKAADEWLARQSETTGWFKRAVQAVRAWLRKHMPSLAPAFTTDEKIALLIRAAREHVTGEASGEKAAAAGDELSDPAFSLNDDPDGPGLDYLPEEVKARIEGSRGVPAEPWGSRFRKIWNQIKAERHHFPKLQTIENETVRHKVADLLRIHQEIPETVRRQAFDMIKGWTKGLSRQEYEHFRMRIILGDLVRDINRGLFHVDDEMTEEKELPFGFESVQDVITAYEGNQAVIDANENLSAAVAARLDAVNNIKRRLVNAKLLKKEVLKDDEYFHHQVLLFWNEKYGLSTSSSDVRTKWRPWMVARKGSALDYNTEYVEAEFMAISQQLGQLATVDTLERIKRVADIYQDLKKLAKGKNIAALWEKLRFEGRIERYPADHERAGQEIDPLLPFKQRIAMSNQKLAKMAYEGTLEYDSEWEDLVEQLAASYDIAANRETPGEPVHNFDHPRWFHFLTYLLNKQKPGANWAATIYKAIRERNSFIQTELGDGFRTFKDEIPEGFREWKPEPNNGWFWANSIADQDIQKVMSGEKRFEDVNVRKLLAKGQDLIWVIPDGLADQMDNFRDQVSTGSQYGVGQLGDKGMRFWKQWILINPYSVLRYNTNNMSGDLDIVLAYDPKILKYAFQALKDLRSWHAMRDMPADAKAFLDDARRLGVIGSGFSVQEVDDVMKLVSQDKEIREILLDETGSGWDPRTWPGRYWKKAQGWTALRENVLRLAAYRFFLEHSSEKRYGASKPKEIDAISNKKEKAAKLARELLGDYGNISHTGGWIRRRMMPFYSWLEINAPRYVYLMRNTKYEKRQAGTAGRMAAVGAKKTMMAAGKLTLRAAGLYGAIMLWNSVMFPDEEELLGESGRNQLHIILGRREDGTIMTLRFQGALSDALSFFALEDFPADIKDVTTGKRTLLDKMKEVPKALFNRGISGIRPDVKMLFELITGRVLYPDALNPRPIRDSVEHVLRTFKLEKIYQEAMGRPRPGGEKWYNRLKQDIKSLLLYENDPGEQAYYTTRNLVIEFKTKGGDERRDATPTRKGNAFYYYKKALRYGDMKAAAKYLDKYYELGGRPKDRLESLDRAHPLAGIPVERRLRFKKGLSKKDAATVAAAIEWYQNTYGRKGG